MPQIKTQIAMTKSANYVTQQGIWDNQRLGLLTNRRIAHYQRLGYYSNGLAKLEVKEKGRMKRKQAIAKCWKGF